MQAIVYSLVAAYVLFMPVLFFNWYGLYQKSDDMTATDRQICRVVLMIATLAWPIVLPLSYMELINKVKRYERRAVKGTAHYAIPEMY
jgi:hypothetical protein